MIVCITGMSGAGKSEVAAIFRRNGYAVYELGDIVKEEMRKRNLEMTPETVKRFSIYLRKRYGKNVTSRKLLKKYRIRQGSRTVISGFRSMADLNCVKRRLDVITIAVVAPTKTRFSRTVVRRRPQDPRTMEEFVRDRDKKEARFGMLAVIKSADYVISNTGTLRELERSVAGVAKDAGLF